VVKTETVQANSRKTFNMAEHSGINWRAAIMVVCKTAGKEHHGREVHVLEQPW